MFEATPPNRWERWKDRRGCPLTVALWVAVWALALAVAVLAGVNVGLAVTDDWGQTMEAGQ